ncbi:MAG: hypothetical protein PHU23_02955 [Dehalococcoidales bacterium]|nr:hypothetical protein [Dehalococcoidales bacterium]
MDSDNHLNINEAVKTFLSSFKSLSRLPLITDAEMDRVFGKEVSAALAKLYSFNEEQEICRGCLSRCCLLVRCELYDPRLVRCPIYTCRPVLCRMHFCDRYTRAFGLLVKDIGDIFLESLSAAERLDPLTAGLLDSPPLGGPASRLTGAILPVINSIGDGCLDEVSGRKLILDEVEKYYREKINE